MKVSTCRKKKLNKRKRFPQDRKSIFTLRYEQFVQKYVSGRQKHPSLAGINEKWTKINLCQPKNQFSHAEIRLHLKRLLSSNFKIFNRALNKMILFLLDRKFVSSSRNEEFGKKSFPLRETVFTSQKNSVYYEQRSFSDSFHIISIMFTSSKKDSTQWAHLHRFTTDWTLKFHVESSSRFH